MAKHNGETKYVVRVRINGKPRLRIGAWLIHIGARIAKVHARVWIEEQSPRMGSKKR